MKSRVDSVEINAPKPQFRSRISNGSCLLPGIDGRSSWVRRLRDLIQLHLADLGGDSEVSEAERSIIRRAAALTVELERMEIKFAEAGAAQSNELETYQRCANTLRRLLESIGFERRPRELNPERERLSKLFIDAYEATS